MTKRRQLNDRRTRENVAAAVRQKPPNSYARPPMPLSSLVWLVKTPSEGLPAPVDDVSEGKECDVYFVDPEGAIKARMKPPPNETEPVKLTVYNLTAGSVGGDILHTVTQLGGQAVIGVAGGVSHFVNGFGSLPSGASGATTTTITVEESWGGPIPGTGTAEVSIYVVEAVNYDRTVFITAVADGDAWRAVSYRDTDPCKVHCALCEPTSTPSGSCESVCCRTNPNCEGADGNITNLVATNSDASPTHGREGVTWVQNGEAKFVGSPAACIWEVPCLPDDDGPEETLTVSTPGTGFWSVAVNNHPSIPNWDTVDPSNNRCSGSFEISQPGAQPAGGNASWSSSMAEGCSGLGSLFRVAAPDLFDSPDACKCGDALAWLDARTVDDFDSDARRELLTDLLTKDDDDRDEIRRRIDAFLDEQKRGGE